MTDPLVPVLAEIDRSFGDSVERLKEFLRIPSVGTDPAHDADTRRAAEWLRAELVAAGLAAELRPTPGQPMVVAKGGRGEGPRLLYYGHYDVQPPDPLDLWQSPPFEPTIVEGPHGPRIVARGAVDDKGQLLTWVEAMRAWKRVHGQLPVPVTVLVEGEEESSSVNLEPFIREHRGELAADVAIVSDTGMLGVDLPAITTILRGIVYLEATLEGPTRDLHSGMYGGAVPNPIHVLAELLASLHDARGRVAIPGFYERVRELDEAERRAWRELPFDERAFLAAIGLERSVGEEGFTLLERLWARPCLDVNGIWGGYTGAGAKTVIPSRAHAKLSCRLVPDQRAEEVRDLVIRTLEERCPPDCRIEVRDLGCGDPIRVTPASPYMAVARRALARVFGREPALIGCGGSIPVAASFRKLLGLDTLLVGFGLDDDRVHSPNEKFELVCYRRGIETHAAMLAEFAALAS